MQRTVLDIWRRVKGFLRDNPVLMGVLFFLLLAGMMAGASYYVQAAHIQADVREIPTYMHARGVPFVKCLLISFCVHSALACMLLLAGIWFPAIVCWPASILLRGILTGVYMGMCLRAWPGASAIWLLVVLLLDIAVLLPVLSVLSSISMKHFLGRCKEIAHAQTGTKSAQSCTMRFLKVCLGLLPCLVLEGIVAPFVLYVFC